MDTTIETQATGTTSDDSSLSLILANTNHRIKEDADGFTAFCNECSHKDRFGAKADLVQISMWLHHHYSNCPKRGGVAA